MSDIDPAVIAIVLIMLVVAIGMIVHFALERRLNRKIAKLSHAVERREYRFECTCGWHGWRAFDRQPISMKCPRCNGVAVQLRYRETEL
jgi:Zn finger protein HypA/HybF involved in hydrogenase expression